MLEVARFQVASLESYPNTLPDGRLQTEKFPLSPNTLQTLLLPHTLVIVYVDADDYG
uniref:AlNc14C499G11941 protein n=1 Tax=Albugo laibachii Nc14 TaxID=890382 RepID=F0X0J6_9STRA|nr:AlNc14C499G11941 [Albugo laibachii Nc14]|eukprot:CCA27287.1 AlNc14C499G11941 [Albugo laibachii Nc14]